MCEPHPAWLRIQNMEKDHAQMKTRQEIIIWK